MFCAVVGETGKTAVLPGFCELERGGGSGGAPGHCRQVNVQANAFKLRLFEFLAADDSSPTYLQPHYGNGVFSNAYYLLALDITKR